MKAKLLFTGGLFFFLNTLNIFGQTDCNGYIQHYWKLEEASQPLFYDYSGTLNISVVNAPSQVEGKVGYAQNFNGSNQANIPDNLSFDWESGSSFSIEFWMNKSTSCSSQSISDNNVIIGRDDPSTQLHWWAGVSCADPGKVNFNLIDANGSGQNLVSKKQVIDGNWHHIAIVRNGISNVTGIYIDGNLDTTLTHAYTGTFNSTAPINVGWLNLAPNFYYNGMLDELALYNRALTLTEIQDHYNSGAGKPYCIRNEEPVTPVKIMPLGNSITFDNNINDTRPVGDKIAYRYHLYNLLNHAGYTFDFTGSESAGFNYFPDTENAGFPGIMASQIPQLLNTGFNSKDNVQETPGPYLDFYQPDIILLHIGTNNVQESPNDVANILDAIDAYKARTGKDTKIILARIINRATYNQTTTTFNTNVYNMALSRNDPDILFVDMENGVDINYTSDMTDDLHPNDIGYRKMALGWFGILEEILTAKQYKPSILVSPSTNGVANTAYSSKVYGIANPAATYSLKSAPAGMSIDPQTGVISWNTPSAGDFPVTVKASNQMGADSVTYTLHILGQTNCNSNLQHYWKLEEAGQSKFLDFTGTLNISIANSPSRVAGKIGYAQNFNGSNKTNIPDDSSFDWGAASSFSIEFWMNKSTSCSSQSISDNNVIIGRDDPR
ncbi:MAG: hypothetical protein HC905_05785, partial [Bacteroidales bacterium]|nr:hypothetical protein [Bacteroidales bacterium]